MGKVIGKIIHPDQSYYAGHHVIVKNVGDNGASVVMWVEDWWDRVLPGSWMDATGNPAALNYAVRVAQFNLPPDDEVLYGKSPGGLGYLFHMTEITEDIAHA